ncbi:MAG: hypothetical protein C0418_04540 [Coriobacteriaceae bacterium]|nr:hypothetical protein [Coriobacteriaceae bacterium]
MRARGAPDARDACNRCAALRDRVGEHRGARRSRGSSARRGGRVTPRELREFVVYGFETTHAALDAEDLLKAGGVSVVPIPAPRALGVSCGIAMRVSPEETAAAERILTEGRVDWASRAVMHDV